MHTNLLYQELVFLVFYEKILLFCERIWIFANKQGLRIFSF